MDRLTRVILRILAQHPEAEVTFKNEDAYCIAVHFRYPVSGTIHVRSGKVVILQREIRRGKFDVVSSFMVTSWQREFEF